MKPYASYKPSGVPWLGGDIPSQWAPKRVKHVATMQSGEGITAETIDESGSYPVYGGNGIRGFTTEKTHSGEFVLVGRQGALCGNVHHVVGDFWASEHAVVSTLYAGDKPRWAAYMLEFMNLGQYSMAAAQPGLAVDKIQQLRLPVPPPDEQQAIADYLDAETARIDTLIHEKDELIGLLREWRQSVIAEAVTKGLDKSAATKPSGVPWLGDVPSHWEVCSLRHAMDGLAMNGVFKKNEEFGDGVPLVNVSNLFREDFSLDAESLERVLCTPEEIEKYEVRGGDLFLVRSSLKLEGIAQFAVAREVNEPTVFECHVVRIRPDLLLTFPVFLSYYLNAPFARQSLVSRSKTTTMTTIDQNEALSTPLLLPPFDEQQAIADYLDAETAKIDDLIAHTHDEITLLKELRAATIADAVLGRIDVRTIPLACRDTP